MLGLTVLRELVVRVQQGLVVQVLEPEQVKRVR